MCRHSITIIESKIARNVVMEIPFGHVRIAMRLNVNDLAAEDVLIEMVSNFAGE